jgi:hypothetical protein
VIWSTLNLAINSDGRQYPAASHGDN